MSSARKVVFENWSPSILNGTWIKIIWADTFHTYYKENPQGGFFNDYVMYNQVGEDEWIIDKVSNGTFTRYFEDKTAGSALKEVYDLTWTRKRNNLTVGTISPTVLSSIVLPSDQPADIYKAKNFISIGGVSPNGSYTEVKLTNSFGITTGKFYSGQRGLLKSVDIEKSGSRWIVKNTTDNEVLYRDVNTNSIDDISQITFEIASNSAASNGTVLREPSLIEKIESDFYSNFEYNRDDIVDPEIAFSKYFCFKNDVAHFADPYGANHIYSTNIRQSKRGIHKTTAENPSTGKIDVLAGEVYFTENKSFIHTPKENKNLIPFDASGTRFGFTWTGNNDDRNREIQFCSLYTGKNNIKIFFDNTTPIIDSGVSKSGWRENYAGYIEYTGLGLGETGSLLSTNVVNSGNFAIFSQYPILCSTSVEGSSNQSMYLLPAENDIFLRNSPNDTKSNDFTGYNPYRQEGLLLETYNQPPDADSIVGEDPYGGAIGDFDLDSITIDGKPASHPDFYSSGRPMTFEVFSTELNNSNNDCSTTHVPRSLTANNFVLDDFRDLAITAPFENTNVKLFYFNNTSKEFESFSLTVPELNGGGQFVNETFLGNFLDPSNFLINSNGQTRTDGVGTAVDNGSSPLASSLSNINGPFKIESDKPIAMWFNDISGCVKQAIGWKTKNYKPNYGSRFNFEAENSSWYGGNYYLDYMPNGLNSLKCTMNLKFRGDQEYCNGLIASIQSKINASKYGDISASGRQRFINFGEEINGALFGVDTGFYQNYEGSIVQNLSIDNISKKVYEVNLELYNDRVSPFLKNGLGFVNNSSDKISPTGTFLNGSTNIEKHSVTSGQTSHYGNNIFNTYLYASKDVESSDVSDTISDITGNAVITGESNNGLTQVFYFKPDRQVNLNFDYSKTINKFTRSVSQQTDVAYNSNYLSSLNLFFKNRSEKETYAILNFLETHMGYRPFVYYHNDELINANKYFICESWNHILNYKDSNDIELVFREISNPISKYANNSRQIISTIGEGGSITAVAIDFNNPFEEETKNENPGDGIIDPINDGSLVDPNNQGPIIPGANNSSDDSSDDNINDSNNNGSDNTVDDDDDDDVVGGGGGGGGGGGSDDTIVVIEASNNKLQLGFGAFQLKPFEVFPMTVIDTGDNGVNDFQGVMQIGGTVFNPEFTTSGFLDNSVNIGDEFQYVIKPCDTGKKLRWRVQYQENDDVGGSIIGYKSSDIGEVASFQITTGNRLGTGLGGKLVSTRDDIIPNSIPTLTLVGGDTGPLNQISFTPTEELISIFGDAAYHFDKWAVHQYSSLGKLRFIGGDFGPNTPEFYETDKRNESSTIIITYAWQRYDSASSSWVTVNDFKQKTSSNHVVRKWNGSSLTDTTQIQDFRQKEYILDDRANDFGTKYRLVHAFFEAVSGDDSDDYSLLGGDYGVQELTANIVRQQGTNVVGDVVTGISQSSDEEFVFEFNTDGGGGGEPL